MLLYFKLLHFKVLKLLWHIITIMCILLCLFCFITKIAPLLHPICPELRGCAPPSPNKPTPAVDEGTWIH